MRKLKFLLLMTSLVFIFAKANAFSDGYMSSQNVVMTLNQKFGGIALSNDDYQAPCRYVEYRNEYSSRSILGDINLQTGEHTPVAPGPSFINWINKCTDSYMNTLATAFWALQSPQNYSDPVSQQYVKIWTTQLTDQMFARVLPKIDQIAAQSSYKFGRLQVLSSSSSLPELMRGEAQNLVASLTEWVLGSDEEILSYGKIQDVDQLRADLARSIENETDLIVATKKILKILFKRDEFLMY